MSSHDHHFLERLERLEREHLELALGLYYDHQLVALILGAANIPEDAERVALCLGKPDVGPHVIVTRDGHFVTCLAEGMQLREGQPVISRPRLDKISETVESLRSLVADSSAGNQGRARRRLARLFEAGPGLSREEFEDIARWLPLMRGRFLLLHMDMVDSSHELVDRLARVKHWNRRNDELLHAYWCSTWAIAHLTALLASDDELLRNLFEPLEEDIPGSALQLPWNLIRLGVISFALRGAWVASKLPTLVVPAAKRRYLDPEATLNTTMTDALSLITVALRHRRYQGEIRKVFARGELAPEAITKHEELIRLLAAQSLEPMLANPDTFHDHARLDSRELVRQLFPDDEEGRRIVDAMPDDVPLAVVAAIPTSMWDDMRSVPLLLGRMPWVARIDASAFYLPEAYCNLLRPPWQRDEGLALLRPRLAAGAPPRPQPVVATPKPPRNGPCPCGSGRKYKKCCGGPGNA